VANVFPAPALPASAPPTGPRHGCEGILALVNGVLADIGGVYISTRSALITVVAALTSIILTAIMLLHRREPACCAGNEKQL
jgi:hypothetical protein